MRHKLQAFLLCLFLLPFIAQADETVTYLHHDALGSIIGTSDAAGNLQKTEYLAYGTKSGEVSTETAKLGYTGKPYFKDLGLSYYGSRWYDPDAGRFTGIDPVSWSKDYAVHSFNRYAYANNNPYKYVDPDGEIAWFVVFAFVGKEAAAEGLSYLTGGLTDFLSFRKMGIKVAKEVAENFTEKTLTTAVRNGIKDLPAGITKEGVQTLEQRAADLVKRNSNKNSVTIKHSNGQVRVDLAGKAHYSKELGDVPTPHIQNYKNNLIPSGPRKGQIGNISKDGDAIPADANTLRMVDRYLNSKGQ